MEEHRDLFDDLANCILCPACKKKTSKPFFSLGPKFHYHEGCAECSKLHNPKETIG